MTGRIGKGITTLFLNMRPIFEVRHDSRFILYECHDPQKCRPIIERLYIPSPNTTIVVVPSWLPLFLHSPYLSFSLRWGFHESFSGIFRNMRRDG